MLVLIFYSGSNKYACACAHVVEITPHVPLKKDSFLPIFVAGLLNYKGKLIPVIDWCQLVDQRRCQDAFHSRIILFKNNDEMKLGIIAEKVIYAEHQERIHFINPHDTFESTPFLQWILYEGEMVRWVLIEKLMANIFAQIEGRA